MFIDSDHIWGVGGDSTWVWKVFTRGYNPLYLDSYGDAEEPTPRNQNETLDAIGQTIAYGQKMNLLNIQPSSGTCNTGYCLAGGGEYLVFNPSNSTTTVKNLPAGTYSYEWLNVGSGSISAPATFTQSSTGDVSPSGRPSAAHVLYMKKL